MVSGQACYIAYAISNSSFCWPCFIRARKYMTLMPVSLKLVAKCRRVRNENIIYERERENVANSRNREILVLYAEIISCNDFVMLCLCRSACANVY